MEYRRYDASYSSDGTGGLQRHHYRWFALLRRFAEGAAERDRVAEDARSATAQARFTGYLVVAMPAGAALFTELLRPGFFASIVTSVPALILVGLSLVLQLSGFILISRLARIGVT